jgi:hypothetical protein
MPKSRQRAGRKSHDQAQPYGVILDAKAVTLGTRQLVYRVAGRPNRQWRILLPLFVISLAVFIAGLTALVHLWKMGADNGTVEDRFARQVSVIDSRLGQASDNYQSDLLRAMRTRDPVLLFDAASSYEADLKRLIAQANALAQSVPDGLRATHALGILKTRLNMVENANSLMLDGAYSAEFRAGAFDAVSKAQAYSSSQDMRERELLQITP